MIEAIAKAANIFLSMHSRRDIDFVELGVAMFTKVEVEKHIYQIREPLVWTSLFILLREPQHRELLAELLTIALKQIQGRGMKEVSAEERGRRAEKAIALILWYMTEPGKHLRVLVHKTIAKRNLDVQLPTWYDPVGRACR